MYKDELDYKNAIDIYTILYQKSLKTQDSLQIALVLDNLGYVQSKTDSPDALVNLKKALDIRKNKNYLVGLHSSYSHLAAYYLDRNDTSQARRYSQNVLNLANAIKSSSLKLDALSLFMRMDNKPFELLITDLSFKANHRSQKYLSGEALVEKLKSEFSTLKVIVYSVEDRLQPVRNLFNKHGIDAFVCKSRSGLKNLTTAIDQVFRGATFLSNEVSNAFNNTNELEIDDYDISLLDNLSKGLSQEEISALYKEKHIAPASLSSIEKRLNKLRIQFNANNAIHLVAIVKDLGLI